MFLRSKFWFSSQNLSFLIQNIGLRVKFVQISVFEVLISQNSVSQVKILVFEVQISQIKTFLGQNVELGAVRQMRRSNSRWELVEGKHTRRTG